MTSLLHLPLLLPLLHYHHHSHCYHHPQRLLCRLLNYVLAKMCRNEKKDMLYKLHHPEDFFGYRSSAGANILHFISADHVTHSQLTVWLSTDVKIWWNKCRNLNIQYCAKSLEPILISLYFVMLSGCISEVFFRHRLLTKERIFYILSWCVVTICGKWTNIRRK